MTATEIQTALSNTGLEFAYYKYPENEVPELPYGVYYFPNSNGFFADGTNYAGKFQLNVELYTKQKSFENEALIDNALNDLGISYTKYESYIPEERMYEVLYESEVILDGK